MRKKKKVVTLGFFPLCFRPGLAVVDSSSQQRQCMCVAPFPLPLFRPHRVRKNSPKSIEKARSGQPKKKRATSAVGCGKKLLVNLGPFWHQLKGKDCPNSHYARMTTMQWKHSLGSLE